MKTGGRIAIIGAGAVGCYYGGRLVEHGQDVHFLMRSDYETVNRDGLSITSPLGDAHLKVQANRSTQDIGPCDLVIIALKATSNTALLELIPPLLHEETLLLTLQNGLGNEDFLATHFGAQRVLGGLCFVCINRTAPASSPHPNKCASHPGAARQKQCGLPDPGSAVHRHLFPSADGSPLLR